jgi:hypothetical protein
MSTHPLGNTKHEQIIVQYDNDLHVVYANPAALSFTGWQLSEIQGMDYHTFWRVDLDTQSRGSPLSMLNDQVPNISALTQLHQGGRWWKISLSYTYNQDGSRSGLFSQYTQINDPSQPRNTLNQLLENEFLSQPVPHVIVDYNTGNIVLANTAFQELFGREYSFVSRSSIYETHLLSSIFSKPSD